MYSIIGVRKVVSKKDGTHYVELHLTTKDRFVDGLCCVVVFVREDMISHIECLCLDAKCQVYYNRSGRVESVDIIL